MTETLEELKQKALKAQERFNVESQRFWYWQQISIALTQSNRAVHFNDIPAAADALATSWEQRYEQRNALKKKKQGSLE